MVLLRYSTQFMILFLMLFVVSFSYGNIWLDEDFDDGVAFDDVDVYADPFWSPVTNPVTITHTGSVASSRSFEGISSIVSPCDIHTCVPGSIPANSGSLSSR